MHDRIRAGLLRLLVRLRQFPVRVANPASFVTFDIHLIPYKGIV